MSRHHASRSAGVGDPPCAPTHEYFHSSSSKASPRSSPPLFASKNELTAEPRSVSATSINQYYDSDQGYGSNNYTIGGGSSDPFANSHGRWYTKHRYDDMERRLATLELPDTPRSGWGVDPGMNDSKDIPRSYAEVVKTSPVTDPAHPTYQAAPPRPKSPKKSCRETRRPQAHPIPAAGVERSPQKHAHSIDKGLKSIIRSTGGHNQAVDNGATRITKNDQPVARGVTLDENTLHATYQRRSTHLEKIYSRPLKNGITAIDAQRSGQRGIVKAKSAGHLSSFSDNAIGIGEWVVSGPCDRGVLLNPGLPRVVSTDSPGYQRLPSRDAVVQCASSQGNSKAAGSNKEAASGKSRAGRQTEAGRVRKQNTRKRPNKKANNGEGDDDGSDGNSNELDEPKSSPNSPPFPKWYPCHFHKRNPQQYTTNGITRKLYMSCSSMWDDIPRLKEHLYRVHCDPYTCGRCQAEFKTKKQLMAHQENQSVASCPILQPKIRVPKEISTAVQDQLRERPKRGMSDEERWFAIWDLLFPGVEHPSFASSDLQEFQQRFFIQRMDSLKANLGPLMENMGLSENQKNELIAAALQQEKVACVDYLDMQNHDSPSPDSASEDIELSDVTLPLVETSYGPSQMFYPQSDNHDASMSVYTATSNYRQQSGQHCNPQPAIFAQPTTPAALEFSQERLRPSTPAPYSTSEKSGDSGYRSTSHPSAVSDDGCIDPALLTPSHIPHSRKHTAPSHGPNVENGDHLHLMSYNQSPIPPSQQYAAPRLRRKPNIDSFMTNGSPENTFPNDDTYGSRDYTWQ